jgi:SAM-dependent methyltransferase
MHWRIKGLVQRALGVLPGGTWVNDRLQQSLGGLRRFDHTIEDKVVNDWLVLVANLKEMGAGVRDRDFLEVGTGWIPVLPVCFSLAGASSCTTIDITRHMNARMTFRMMARLEEYLPRIAAAAESSLETIRAAYRALREAASLPELLDRARIRYLSPADARATGLAEESVDVVFSNNVFEHVPAEVLDGILRESRRILRPGGLSIHSANCADHYAYFDRNITFVHYLAYSERRWRFWNNPLQYQNRLRPQDFSGLAERAGLEVKLYKMRVRPELRPALEQMTIAPEFRHYSAEQLCATSVLIGGRKPPSGC